MAEILKAKIIKMNELQQLIIKLKVAEKAQRKEAENRIDRYSVGYYNGRADQCAFIIQKIDSLLKVPDTEASTEAAIAQTPCKANVPPEVGTSNIDVSAAASCATPFVRQNEQAKEVLLAFINTVEDEFKDENWDYLYFIMERMLEKQVLPIGCDRRMA